MKILSSIFILFLSINLYGQVVFANLGIGFSTTKADFEKFQNSFDSYKRYLNQNFPNDPFEYSGNWKDRQFASQYHLQAGAAGKGVHFSLTWSQSTINQTQKIIRQSGYGRKFDWKETRSDVLFDVGFGQDKLSIFGIFGTNFTNQKMVSSIVYPDGTLSQTNEFTFNGVFRGFDVGLSYGLGLQIRPVKYMSLDVRYFISTDRLFDGPEEVLAYSDNTNARVPGTNHLPEDYTRPLSLSNEINVGVRRSFLQFTVGINLINQKWID